MKTLNKILCVTACAAVFSSTARVTAQYQTGGEDGIAASPKVRQFLNESKTVASPGVVADRSRDTTDERIAASPRARQFLNEHRIVANTTSSAGAATGYTVVGDDGV